MLYAYHGKCCLFDFDVDADDVPLVLAPTSIGVSTSILSSAVITCELKKNVGSPSFCLLSGIQGVLSLTCF